MESIDHGGYLAPDSHDYEVRGMCHKLTPSQYVLLTLVINVIFLREKKAVKLMKDTDEHLCGWPNMHRYAQMQLSPKRGGEGEICRYIIPFNEYE